MQKRYLDFAWRGALGDYGEMREITETHFYFLAAGSLAHRCLESNVDSCYRICYDDNEV